MTRNELCKSIYELAHLQGTFKLRSRQTSNEYFDKYLFESNPVILRGCKAKLGNVMCGIV